MRSRRRQSPFEDLLDVAATLPWWLGLLLALISYLVLHSFASIAPLKVTGTPDTAQMAVGNIYGALAYVLQFVIPAAFVIGAGVSALRRHRSKRLFEETQKRAMRSSILNLSWRDFERLVGESFRRRGYSVIENDGAGADGGVDLVLAKGAEKFLVQCKRWKATMVGVEIVRELFGVMAARGAAGGFVVTSGSFSRNARAFAEGRNIELIAGDKLLAMIQEVQQPEPTTGPLAQTGVAPACPSCGSSMVRRVARKGSNAGRAFWGCSAYPRCKRTRAVE